MVIGYRVRDTPQNQPKPNIKKGTALAVPDLSMVELRRIELLTPCSDTINPPITEPKRNPNRLSENRIRITFCDDPGIEDRT